MPYISVDQNPPPRRDFLQARDSPAVMKLKLSNFRSRQPDTTVLAFEGDDDKTIYAQWVRRVRDDLRYEPFICGGKTGVLNLAEVVSRDKSGDGNYVYCFVDRDFDDLRGGAHYPHLFMTSTYSTENMLVARNVLNELLTNEFHCNGVPEIRAKICDLFDATYDKFLALTKAINLRLYVLRRLNVRPAKPLPEKLNSAVVVKLDTVDKTSAQAEEVVVYADELKPDDVSRFAVEFEAMAPRDRYRGKWALGFFQTWISLLAAEHRDKAVGLFDGIGSTAKVRHAELVRSNFSARSALPIGFREFVTSVQTKSS